jgi:predicted transcriptional regulator of viral defense system
MEDLRIQEALVWGARKRGSKITITEVAEKVFPQSKLNVARVSASNLVNGKTKRISAHEVKVICALTGVDANYIFNINPMED